MNNKGVGAIFCLIAALLISARYLTAAVFMSNLTSWDAETFQLSKEYTGPVLTILAVIALVVGIGFLVYGMLGDRKGK